MPPILNAQGLAKAFGAAPLFQNVSFTVSEGDRIGLIGPNGSGKSTLMRILAGQVSPDSGEVVSRKHTVLSYVEQDSEFAPDQTVRSVIETAMLRANVPQTERDNRLAETLGRAGFEQFGTPVATLSGGWRKRLAVVEALVQHPDILLLDEPTNHLDLAGIEWLESLLEAASFACVVVSHDRYFLENVTTQMAELNRVYPDGMLRVNGNYSSFLEKKEEFLEAQTRRQEALENRVRGEIEWLRRGAKARTSKSKARIDRANQMIGELADLNSRTRTAVANIDFNATERQTKRLIELQQLRCTVAGRTLFSDLDFIITARMRLGLVGPNGSGKTTLLRLIHGDLDHLIQPQTAAPQDTVSPETLSVEGTIRRAPSLQVVYFDQNRQLDPDLTLRRTLAPNSDSVVYQDRVIHVASWAARFLFTSEQLNQPVGRLSGGERARVLIARLMLQPADVLLLDEPTNDLDIPTLEILEESLLEYPGALVLVTHDRYVLDRVSQVVLGLDGDGAVERFADYQQWEAWQSERLRISKRKDSRKLPPVAESNGAEQFGTDSNAPARKKKLSYLEAREYATIEQRIAEAEDDLRAKRAALEDPTIATDAARLLDAQAELESAQKTVDDLVARWAELEEKQG